MPAHFRIEQLRETHEVKHMDRKLQTSGTSTWALSQFQMWRLLERMRKKRALHSLSF